MKDRAGGGKGALAGPQPPPTTARRLGRAGGPRGGRPAAGTWRAWRRRWPAAPEIQMGVQDGVRGRPSVGLVAILALGGMAAPAEADATFRQGGKYASCITCMFAE